MDSEGKTFTVRFANKQIKTVGSALADRLVYFDIKLFLGLTPIDCC